MNLLDTLQYCIDTLKETVPIWKRESWAGGDDWGTGAHDIGDVSTRNEARTEVRP